MKYGLPGDWRFFRCRWIRAVVLLAGFCRIGSAVAGTLTLETVTARALVHGEDIRIADVDLEISRFSREEVRALYYPIFKLRLDNEYIHVYDENEVSQVSVGGYVSSNLDSAYQNGVVASITYDIYQFGVRPLRFENAEREVRIAALNRSRQTLETQLAVLEVYRQGLTLEKQRQAARAITACRKAIYAGGQRLQAAGRLGRRDVIDFAVDLAEAVNQSDQIDTEYLSVLNALGRLTGETYDPIDTLWADLTPADALQHLPDPAAATTVRAIDEEIRKKETEVQIAAREMYPRIYFYGAHRMYGKDDNNFGDALSNVRSRDATMSVYTEWDVFDGFRRLSRRERLKSEVKRLRLEREKRVAELGARFLTLVQTGRILSDAAGHRKAQADNLARHREALSRLTTGQILERIAALKQEVDIIEQQMAQDLLAVRQAAAVIELKLYQEDAAS